MSLPIRFLPEAKTEFDDAADWYERQRAGLGADFVARVRDLLKTIAIAPERHAPVYGPVRKALVSRFPDIVVDREESTEIVVISVFHTSRDPSVWQSRV